MAESHCLAERSERLAYSVREVCELLSVSRSWLHERTASGEIRSIRCGGRRLYPRSVLDDLLAGGKGLDDR